MITKLNPKIVTAIGLGFFLIVTGCQPTADAPSATITVDVVPSAISVSPTHLASETEYLTPAMSPNSPTPLIQATETITLSPTISETITVTPWPTLSPEAAEEKIMSLLADNQNPDCLLPCWWGATPGQTKWQDVAPSLASFTKIDISSSETSFGATVTLPLPESVAAQNAGDYYAFYGWDESGVLHGIAIDPINISGYDPPTMMALYGVPDEVWLSTIDEPREGVLPFQLIIAYQQKGISFRYRVDASRSDNTITACFYTGFVETGRPDLFPAGPRIYVWEPGQTKTIQEISPIPLEEYFPLRSKTDLTQQTLYEKFTNPNELPCIDTPQIHAIVTLKCFLLWARLPREL